MSDPKHAAPRETGRPPAPAAVRPVERPDVEAVWALVRELAEYERLAHVVSGSAEVLDRLLFEPGATLQGVVAEASGRIVGYALFYDNYSTFRGRTRLWLEDLYVQPAARGTGAGRALLAEVARVALRRGCDRVDWYVLDWNELAIDFYHRQGAQHVVSEWLQYGLDEAGLQALAEPPQG